MKSDDYVAEFGSGDTKSNAAENTSVACAEATNVAEDDLVAIHRIR